MLCKRTLSEISSLYTASKKKKTVIDTLSYTYPDVLLSCNERYQITHPELGIVHASNLYCSSLESFCLQYRDYGNDLSIRSCEKLVFSDALITGLSRIKFTPWPECRTRYETTVSELRRLHDMDNFTEASGFLEDLKRWLCSQNVFLEPFQKNCILHVICFLVATRTPHHYHYIFEYIKRLFNIENINTSVLDTFKHKTTVFLVPRRHGKTWILTPIITFLIKNFSNISVGYVAHQKHVSQHVMKEVEILCRREIPYVVENKDNVISVIRTNSRSCALFASCFNTNSIRGQSFNILLVDESNFIKKEALHAIIGFLAQSTAKIIFISSCNTSTQSTSFLAHVKKTPTQILNVISYVCEEHLYSFGERSEAITCPCYRLHKPTFISLNLNIKKTANAFLKDSFNEEILGTTNTSFLANPILTDSSVNEFDMIRYSTVNKQLQEHLADTLFVYVDPAFTTNRRASGTGVAGVGRYNNQFIVYGIEHFYLKSLADTSEDSIGECVAFMISGIIKIHPFFTMVRVLIEGNSSQAASVKIAYCIKAHLSDSACILQFYQTLDQNGFEQPFFLLKKNKRAAVEHFVSKFNSNLIKASQEIISHTIKLNFDPIEYLLLQIKNISQIVTTESVEYTTRKTKDSSDDALVAVIMAIYFCNDQEVALYKCI
ncbi:DNA packaging terminase subunit 1 [Elephantid betaherpesvirus 1]|uniref:Tripartite terminase subunit 3 n=111 Tax=Herpesvirales TaxID=548681 RepID=TRM3_ELHVK|nr:RecName: Full=Tripartite terminase subunit 3; AltName: Full=Terminase large subunit [Elephantid herpesvirus 1 (isolate Kiba)]ABG36582.1 terminase [Elephantid betaherpesvirus 1]AGE09947.1 DNA packaging terminase subunit 1 [Elephantid betaherpesvirus 1]